MTELSLHQDIKVFLILVSPPRFQRQQPNLLGNKNNIMHKMPLHCEIWDENMVSANKPCIAAAPFSLYRQPNQHCCIFQNSTVGGERPNQNRACRNSIICYGADREWYQWFKHLIWACDPNLNIFSLSFNQHRSQSLQHGVVIVATGSSLIINPPPEPTCTNTRWPHSSHTRGSKTQGTLTTHTARACNVGGW